MLKVLHTKAEMCAEKDVKIILVYTPFLEISEGREAKRSDNEKWVETVKEIAESSEIIFILFNNSQ